VTGSLLLDEWGGKSGGWGGVSNKLVGCTSAVLVGGIIQALSSLYLYFKVLIQLHVNFNGFYKNQTTLLLVLYFLFHRLRLRNSGSTHKSESFCSLSFASLYYWRLPVVPRDLRLSTLSLLFLGSTGYFPS